MPLNRSRMIFGLVVGLAVLIVGFSFVRQILEQETSEAALNATAEALQAHYQKGLGYINLGRWQEAKRELEQVFEADPNYQEVQAKLKEVEDQLKALQPPAAGDQQTRLADGAVMVYVPAGSFDMGSTGGESSELPVHTVSLDGFWLDRNQVTNAQFAVFLNTQGNQVEEGVTWLELEDDSCLIEQVAGQYQPKPGYADHPAIEVSWYGALAYCRWVGGRLPSEAEWEYAARGRPGSAYPWGDNPPDCAKANYGECVGETSPAGDYPMGASWCGALDMAGNVWEWAGDWYEQSYYNLSPLENPTGPRGGSYRVVRGGSWSSEAGDLRAAYRLNNPPANRNNDLGFRCVVPAEK